MTYRRLFLILLIGSTLVLAAVWWLSLLSVSDANLSSRTAGGQIVGQLLSGTVVLGIVDGDSNPQTFRSDFNWFTDFAEEASVGLSPWGSFDLGKKRFGTGQVYHLSFPLWAAYLVFIGAAWSAMRVMERRSGSRQENELARKHAAATLGQEE